MIKNNKGSSLIEVLVALSSATIIVTTVLTLTIASHRLHALAQKKTDAIDLATDTLEVAYFMRNENWEDFKNLASDTIVYHPSEVGGTWVLQSNEDMVGSYTRYIELRNVYRNEAGLIREHGTVLDDNMIQARAVVNWTNRGNMNSVELSTIVSNIKK